MLGCGVRSPYPSPAPKPGQKGKETAAPPLGPGARLLQQSLPQALPHALPASPTSTPFLFSGNHGEGCRPSEPVCPAGFQKGTGPDSGLLSKLRDCKRQVGSKVGISLSPGKTRCRNTGGGDRRVRRTWLADHVQGGRCWTDIACRGVGLWSGRTSHRSPGKVWDAWLWLRGDTLGKGGVTPRT